MGQEAEVVPASPQQARLAQLATSGRGRWTPWLHATIEGELDADALQAMARRAVTGHEALRTEIIDARSVRVTQPPSEPALAAEQGPAIRLYRSSREARWELEIETSPGALDAAGLLRTLDLILPASEAGADHMPPDPVPLRALNPALARIADASAEGLSFWRTRLAGALAAASAGDCAPCWRPVGTVAFPAWASPPGRLRAAAGAVWRAVVEAAFPSETAVGLYAPGLAVDLPQQVGLLGRYVPAPLEGEPATWGELIEATHAQQVELDGWADHFPAHAAIGGLPRIGFSFHDRGEARPHVRVEQVRAPLEGFDVELVALGEGRCVRFFLLYDAKALSPAMSDVVAAAVLDLAQALCAPGPPEARPIHAGVDQSVVHGPAVRLPDPDVDVFSLFEDQARAAPQAIAATSDTDSVTFADLLRSAEQVDAALARRGLRAGDRIGICLRQDPMLLATVLGVMRRRAVFVLLDPRHPTSRLEAILAAAEVSLCVHDDLVGPLAIDVLSVRVEQLLAGPDLPLELRPERPGEDLAYILHTSGSTGTPKGVEVGRAALVNYLCWAVDRYEVAEGAGSVLFSSIAFDMALTSFLAPLIAGRSVRFLGVDDFEALADLLRRTERLSFLKLTPGALTLLGQLLPAGVIGRATRHVVLGGESLQAAALQCLAGAADLRITNEYGPTETTVGSVAHTFDAYRMEHDVETVSIGTPIWNTAIAICAAPGRLALRGMPGEILIGGDGVAHGYRGRPDETRARFRSLPAAGSGIWYATGDLGVLEPDGRLSCLGRIDEQVKIHGYRVETGEVESILARCPGVAAAAVVAPRQDNGKHVLSAFATPVAGGGLRAEDLRGWAEAHLPSYARPDRVEVLARLPFAGSGKVDRKALIARSNDALPAGAGGSAGPGATEARLVEAWRRVLGRPPAGPTESFFAAGGDSIKALHLVAAARREGMSLTIAEVLEARTLERMARAARRSEAAVQPVAPSGPLPLLAAQRAFLDLGHSPSTPWPINWIFPAEGCVDLERLAAAHAAVIERHPAMRCRIRSSGAAWRCETPTDPSPGAVSYFRLEAEEDASTREALERHLDDIGRQLNLVEGPAAQLCCFDLGPRRGVHLAWVAHHLIADVVSLQILAAELLAAYRDGPTRASPRDDGYAAWAAEAPDRPTFAYPVARGAQAASHLRTLPAAIGARLVAPEVVGRRRGLAILAAALMRCRLPGADTAIHRICVERQGRTDVGNARELPDAVGWLTAYQTLVAPPGDWTATELAERLHPELLAGGGLPSGDLPPVALNFLGEARARPESFLPAPFALDRTAGADAVLLFPLELVAWLEGGVLSCRWNFDRLQFGDPVVQAVAGAFEAELGSLLADRAPGHLPTRVADPSLTDADLARILADFQ